MPRVRISASVLAEIATYVATPDIAGADGNGSEYAFWLSFEKRDDDYYVDEIIEAKQGQRSSAPTPSERASAHTHHIENYRDQSCHVGWPSGEDMRWLFGVSLKYHGALVVHLCSAVEGTYIVACCLHGAQPSHENGKDIYKYFSSSHGHRCFPGHEDEGYPSADAFVALAHAFRFTGPACQRHAGEDTECDPARPYRERAASDVGGKQVFFVRFVRHDLRPKRGRRTRTYYGRDAKAHLANIRDGAFDHEGTIKVPALGDYVDLVVPGANRPVV